MRIGAEEAEEAARVNRSVGEQRTSAAEREAARESACDSRSVGVQPAAAARALKECRIQPLVRGDAERAVELLAIELLYRDLDVWQHRDRLARVE